MFCSQPKEATHPIGLGWEPRDIAQAHVTYFSPSSPCALGGAPSTHGLSFQWLLRPTGQNKPMCLQDICTAAQPEMGKGGWLALIQTQLFIYNIALVLTSHVQLGAEASP